MIDISKLVRIEHDGNKIAFDTSIFQRRDSSLVDLQKAANKQKEILLIGCVNNLHSKMLKDWFEIVKKVCQLDLLTFIQKQNKMEEILNHKQLSQLLLTFYKNSKHIQFLYRNFFKINNSVTNSKIIMRKVTYIHLFELISSEEWKFDNRFNLLLL